MVRGTERKDRGVQSEAEEEDRVLDKESIEASCNMSWSYSFIGPGEQSFGGFNIFQIPVQD
jgi:hypothetical protein